MQQHDLIRCQALTKSFASVPVLRGVSLDAPPGSILGVVGENGAGKSTLMNLIGGVHVPDSGHMWLSGEGYEPRNPADALRSGIAFVHQELNLFPNLSIADNLSLENPPGRTVLGVRLLDYRAMQDCARRALEMVGLQRPPSTLVESLSPGDRQLVEIARALHARARLIIFDEPTTSLTAVEVTRLFHLLAELRRSRVTILYISHALDHVLNLCDNVLVLRDGAVVDRGSSAQFNESRLIRSMVGREVNQLYPERAYAADPSTAILDVTGLTEPGVIADVTFSIAPVKPWVLPASWARAGRNWRAFCSVWTRRRPVRSCSMDKQFRTEELGNGSRSGWRS